jgi:hypothetical protein
MVTFYLLPPRACLDDALGSLLSRLLPGLPIPADTWEAIAERLAAVAGWPADLVLIARDDLPEGEPIAESLAAGFGAEPGDRVVEVGTGAAPARAWVLPAVSGSAAAR